MHSAPPTPVLLRSKPHLELLDGLRGIAAVAVVVFHFMEIAVPRYQDNFIAHGYLAVDFFFCLSGFVIAYAYDSRIKEIGALTFFKLRLIRLHPLVVIGSVIGLLAFVLDPLSRLYDSYGAGKTAWMFVTSCLLIPNPVVPERYFNIFHLNPPTWSLFWEYIANIFYALILFRLPTKLLSLLTLLAALLLFYAAYHATNLSIGWSGDTFWGGGSRVFYSFLAGMLVYRSGWVIRSGLGFVSLGLLLLAAFLVPYSDSTNWLVDPLLAVVYFPLLLAVGVGATSGTRFGAACRFSGDISYPLYMVHYPFIWLFLSYVETAKPTLAHLALLMPVATLLLIGFAYAVLRLLDVPVRAYLKTRLSREYLAGLLAPQRK